VRGNDWTDLYPLIVAAALHNLSSSFVIDGEALLRCVKKSGNNQPGNASQSR
jgi:ATP-dependent DNA ligase